MVSICQICNNDKESTEVIILRCTHTFCWECIENSLKQNLDSKCKCPLPECQEFLRDVEMRKVLSTTDIEKYEGICLDKIPSRHSCVLDECNEIVLYDQINIQYDCRRCSIFNCIKCKLPHKGLQCDEPGTTLNEVCHKEMLRAKIVLQKRKALINRRSIAKMEANVLVSNSAAFTCQICFRCIGKDRGIIIRQCFHGICRDCFMEYVKNSQSIPVCCPFSGCPIILEDRECREILLGPDKDIYEMKCILHASRNLDNAERCRQYNCNYICDVDKLIKQWKCPMCASVNCISCNTIHDNETCQQYLNSRITCKEELEIERCIREKIYMRCLTCDMLIMKTSGCNWIQCPSCQTELCWINQTYRWGPKGRGDISGGCKCGVNGKMCHPQCSGCIPHRHCAVM